MMAMPGKSDFSLLGAVVQFLFLCSFLSPFQAAGEASRSYPRHTWAVKEAQNSRCSKQKEQLLG